MGNLNEIITEEFERMLSEIGESNVEPYQYSVQSTPEYLLYRFTTEDSDNYQVTIRKDVRIGDMLSIWLVEFGVVVKQIPVISSRLLIRVRYIK